MLNVHVVWEEYNPVFGVNEVFYRRSTDVGSSWQSTIGIGTEYNGLSSDVPDATPVIADYGSRVVVAWRYNYQGWYGGIAARVDPSYNDVWYPIGGSDVTSSKPSISCGSGDTQPFQIVFVNGTSSIKHVGLSLNAYQIIQSSATEIASGSSLANPCITQTSTVWGDRSVIVTWDALNGSTRHIFARTRSSDGLTWSSPLEFSHGTHQCTQPVASFDQNDNKIVLLWQCDNHIAKTTRAQSGTTWSPVSDRGTGSSPAIVARRDAGQSSLAAWMTGTAAPYALNLPSLTPAAPTSFSSTATIGNGQRKLVRGSSGTLYLVYESEGDIFFTKSTDNGVSWAQSVYLSKNYIPSDYPSITERGGQLYVIWQTKVGSGYNVYFTQSTNGGNSWLSAPVTMASSLVTPLPGPTPVIAATGPSASFGLMIVYRTASDLRSNYSTTYPPAPGWTFSTITVYGTNASSKNPTLLYHPNSYPPFRVAWDENGKVKYECFYGTQWSSLLTFDPPYSQNNSPSIAISGDNTVHLAFQGGGGGNNPWIYYTKNLNTSYYTSFGGGGGGTNYLQPSITGHTGGRASLLWYSASNAIKKVVYDGTNWSSEGTIATGGKYVSTSITNPPGGSAYAVWTGASGIPYPLYVGPGGGPLQQAGGDEAITRPFVHSRSVQISTEDRSELLTIEMAKPEVTTATGDRLRLPFKP
ncbi:MAG: sialidase family protein, partial [Bacteroidota bacterium]